MDAADCHRRGFMAHAPPPGYFVQLEDTSAEDDLYLRKKVRMRRWLCCTCHVEESYPSNENEHLKSPKHYADGVSEDFSSSSWMDEVEECIRRVV